MWAFWVWPWNYLFTVLCQFGIFGKVPNFPAVRVEFTFIFFFSPSKSTLDSSQIVFGASNSSISATLACMVFSPSPVDGSRIKWLRSGITSYKLNLAVQGFPQVDKKKIIVFIKKKWILIMPKWIRGGGFNPYPLLVDKITGFRDPSVFQEWQNWQLYVLHLGARLHWVFFLLNIFCI